MKKFYSIISLILVLSLFTAMALGSGSSTKSTKPIVDATVSASDKDSDSGSDAAKESTGAVTTSSKETITEQVLLDQDDIKITATGLSDDSIWGKEVTILVENNSSANIIVQCEYLVINNYMVSNLFSCSVAAGKKSNDSIALLSSSLSNSGITTISDIALKFKVMDENFSSLFKTDEISIQTSAYGTVAPLPMDDGKELYNKGGVKIVGKYVSEDTIWGAGVVLYMENTSDKDIIIQCDNMSINGFMVTPFFSSTVNHGRMSIDPITILNSDLEDNKITSVDEIELVFKILNPNTFSTIDTSDPITFAAK